MGGGLLGNKGVFFKETEEVGEAQGGEKRKEKERPPPVGTEASVWEVERSLRPVDGDRDADGDVRMGQVDESPRRAPRSRTVSASVSPRKVPPTPAKKNAGPVARMTMLVPDYSLSDDEEDGRAQEKNNGNNISNKRVTLTTPSEDEALAHGLRRSGRNANGAGDLKRKAVRGALKSPPPIEEEEEEEEEEERVKVKGKKRTMVSLPSDEDENSDEDELRWPPGKKPPAPITNGSSKAKGKDSKGKGKARVVMSDSESEEEEKQVVYRIGPPRGAAKSKVNGELAATLAKSNASASSSKTKPKPKLKSDDIDASAKTKFVPAVWSPKTGVMASASTAAERPAIKSTKPAKTSDLRGSSPLTPLAPVAKNKRRSSGRKVDGDEDEEEGGDEDEDDEVMPNVVNYNTSAAKGKGNGKKSEQNQKKMKRAASHAEEEEEDGEGPERNRKRRKVDDKSKGRQKQREDGNGDEMDVDEDEDENRKSVKPKGTGKGKPTPKPRVSGADDDGTVEIEVSSKAKVPTGQKLSGTKDADTRLVSVVC